MDIYERLPKGIEKTLNWILCENEVLSWRLVGEQNLILSIRFGQRENNSISTPWLHGTMREDYSRKYRSKPPSSIKRDSERQQRYIAKLEEHSSASTGDFVCPNGVNDSILLTNTGTCDQDVSYLKNDCSLDAGYHSQVKEALCDNGHSKGTNDNISKSRVQHTIVQTDRPIISQSSQTIPRIQNTCFTQHPNVKKQITQTEKITTVAKRCQTISPEYQTTSTQCLTETCHTETMAEMSENRDQDQRIDEDRGSEGKSKIHHERKSAIVDTRYEPSVVAILRDEMFENIRMGHSLFVDSENIT